MTAKTSISLTDQQYAFARAQVEAGRFSSVSAVLQQALEAMRQDVEARDLDREMLRTLIEQRRKEPTISGEELDRRLDQAIAQERAKFGLES